MSSFPFDLSGLPLTETPSLDIGVPSTSPNLSSIPSGVSVTGGVDLSGSSGPSTLASIGTFLGSIGTAVVGGIRAANAPPVPTGINPATGLPYPPTAVQTTSSLTGLLLIGAVVFVIVYLFIRKR